MYNHIIPYYTLKTNNTYTLDFRSLGTGTILSNTPNKLKIPIIKNSYETSTIKTEPVLLVPRSTS
jgi:hypothetical protein